MAPMASTDIISGSKLRGLGYPKFILLRINKGDKLKMKFILGEFSHESNSFCEHTTGEAEFKQWELAWGEDVIQSHRGKRTVIGGFIDNLVKAGHERKSVV